MITGSGVIERTWFNSRRDHFVRQVFNDFFLLIRRYHKLYGIYLGCFVQEKSTSDCLHHQRVNAVQVELLQQFSTMVGTEKKNGLLWQLKDLCHQIWPREKQDQHIHGVLVDWLIGSLFHEAMKLKENLYLLNNYGLSALAMNKPCDHNGVQCGQLPAIAHMVDFGVLISRIAGDVACQMERMGFLFGQVNYLLRLSLPELMGNSLIFRLFAEQEEIVEELWGEPLEALFNDLFFGQAAVGFCRAGASYLRGQWYQQALGMYQRALFCDHQCDEAITRVAHLKAILRNNPEGLNE